MEMLGCGAVEFAIEHEVDAALAEQIDGFRAVAPRIVQAKLAQLFAEPARRFIVYRELDELDALEPRRWW